jgi:hypothetical protein
MCVDLVLLDEGSAELVDYPRVESAEHSYFAEVAEHLHLDEVVDQQQQQHLIHLVQNFCPRLGQRHQPSSAESCLKMQRCVSPLCLP